MTIFQFAKSNADWIEDGENGKELDMTPKIDRIYQRRRETWLFSFIVNLNEEKRFKQGGWRDYSNFIYDRKIISIL